MKIRTILKMRGMTTLSPTPATLSGLPLLFVFLMLHIVVLLLTKVEIGMRCDLSPVVLHSAFAMVR